jgi:glycosyltransferase involved in cell wall biosynthesis
MKIIAILPVKNEEWILEKTLKSISNFCDVIIVGDSNSTDSTPELCKKFPKVVYLRVNDVPHPKDLNRRQVLLDTAREYKGNNVIFCLDADEIVTANILNNTEWADFLNELKPGESVLLQWIALWGDPNKYRDDDSPWSNNWKHFLFRDDKKTNYALGNLQESRIPKALESNAKRFNNVKVLHYQFVVWDRMLSKQCYYRIIERITLPDKSFLSINSRYGITKDERNMILKNVPKNWVEPWEDLGIDLSHFVDDLNLHWYDVEVLKFFNQFGLKYFAGLDIWDIDWEHKRQLALKLGIRGIPDKPISNPCSLPLKIYHWYLHRFIEPPRVAKMILKRIFK